MILTFQGWRFQRWRQASFWTAKKIRRQRIRGITRRRLKSNARGACRIIGGNSTSRFCTIESHGNDSKTSKLDALWTETERRWKAIFHLRTADSKTTEKRFFASDCDWKWEVDNPKKKKYYAKPGQSLPGTKRVLFTISCWNLAILLRAIGISYNWFVWIVHCEKNGRNTNKDMIKFFMTTASYR